MLRSAECGISCFHSMTFELKRKNDITCGKKTTKKLPGYGRGFKPNFSVNFLMAIGNYYANRVEGIHNQLHSWQETTSRMIAPTLKSVNYFFSQNCCNKYFLCYYY